MKRSLRLIIGCTLMVLLSSCNTPVSSTASYIQVISKETGKNNEHGITVKNPYDKNGAPFQITIDDEKLWNLIEVDRIYFSDYDYRDIHGKVTLGNIQLPSEEPSHNERANEAAPDAAIRVSSPVTIAKSPLPAPRSDQSLSLQLVQGSYSEDWNPGPLMGRNWTGEFELVLTGKDGKVIARQPLQPLYADKLQFGDFFEFRFGDYNGDGNPDFTLGQYGSSNGNLYKLFTILKDGRMEELKVEGQNDLFISSGDGRYSTPLKVTGSGMFQKSFYDNAQGKTVTDTYAWDGQKFMKEGSE
ncbi:hypothetical protein P9847_05265 [Paenibacillus chibensis]|uniref:Lipoprotein n=1 Tax=Paenibacillus chibensis TaxID=59846 RepID=A0ABU6PQP1_9BACL|nr:hypothetical protein [Paenibacillus chibensis]